MRSDDLISVYKDGKIFSVKSNKTILIYKNGVGIHEVLDQLHRQSIELEKLRSGEIGKRNLLLTE
tara:strand:- start:757 stop:951 length:195 start_codon:yes stop_codon:yes gene_type:complete